MKNKYIWLVMLILISSTMSTGLYYGAYTRSDDISSVPCLGCLGLDPVIKSSFRYQANEDHPDFVLEELDGGVVFLHYRTDVCSACDAMEPVVDDLEEEYSRVRFNHINLDHAERKRKHSYQIYDIEGSEGDITGVPMFVIMTLKEEGGEQKPYFKVLYGIHEKSKLKDDIEKALSLYPAKKKTLTPAVDLFVDTNCQYCPLSEEALLEKYGEDELYFVTYVTDSPGVSGSYSRYLERRYKKQYGGAGHPRAEFNLGSEREFGAEKNVSERYSKKLSKLNKTAASIGFNLSKEKEEGKYRIGYDIQSEYEGDCDLRIMIIDRYSPWNNIHDEPIPFAFVDNVFNRSIDLEEGEQRSENNSWNGTEELSLDDLGNDLAVFGMISKDGRLLKTEFIPPEMGGIRMDMSTDETPISPYETKRMDLMISNMGSKKRVIDLDVNKDVNWTVSIPNNISVGGGEKREVDVEVTCPKNSSLGLKNNITFEGISRDESYISDRSSLILTVKEDSSFPKIGGIKADPESPQVGEKVEIKAMVGDNEELRRVEISYYVCTEKLCGPVKVDEMNKTGKFYTATVGPFDEKYKYLHYRIKAEDMNGNINKTEEYEIVIQSETVEETPMLDTFPFMMAICTVSLIYYCRKKRFFTRLL